MTSAALFSFLYGWVNQVLNTELSQSITIIQSHQNAPQPSKQNKFMVIQYAPTRTRIGRPAFDEVNGSDQLKRINDYELLVEMREVNGDGDNLRILVESTDREDIKKLFKDAGVAYLGQEDIQTLPRSQDTLWIREHVLEIRLAVAEELTESNMSYIGDMEYEGTLPAQGRTGDHTVTNE